MTEHRPKKRLNPISTRHLDCLTTMGMGVAHDFNNLLAAIQGNAFVVHHALPEDFNAAESLRQIEGCALRGLQLTSRILTFTGRAPFIPKRLNLSQVVREMDDALKGFRDDTVALRYKLGNPMPEIMGDTAQLRQMILDLVTNSSEALVERTGTITIETGTMHCDRAYLQAVSLCKDLPEGPYAYVQVTDDGRGIPVRVQKKMFDPFFTSKLRGQGLGLCVVVGVVRAHDGALDVWTRSHRGSRFKALFPIA